MNFNCYEVKKVDINAMNTSKKWSITRSNYGLWYMRDSRNISGMVGILFFVLMMVIFFTTIEMKRDNHKSNIVMDNIHSLTRSMNVLQSQCSLYGDTTVTSITCDGVSHSQMEDVQQLINDMFAQVANKNNFSLCFVNILDPLEVIEPGWLRKINISLHSLTIQKTELIEINEKSFEGAPFQNLQELRLMSTKDLSLNKRGFEGLNNLSSLILQGPSCYIKSAEADTLHELPVLSVLQITGCVMDPEILRNLTGGNSSFKLNSLKLLDLENNFVSKVLSDSFTKLPILESLYLAKTRLSEGLESAAFRGIYPSQIIMMDMALRKLPEGIFDSYLKSNTSYKIHIDLSSNMWNCSCDFQWFQELYNTDRWIFMGEPLLCYDNEVHTSLSNYSFCGSTIQPTAATTRSTVVPTGGSTGQDPSSTLQPTIPSTDLVSTTNPPVKTSTKPSTKIPDHFDPIQCFPANRSSRLFDSSHKSTPRVIYLGVDNFRFSFTQIGDEPKYKVSIDRTLSDDLTLIFIDRDGWIFCLSELQNHFNVENLIYGQSYIVCLLRSSQYMVSPRNCQSLIVPDEWGKQTWISNDQMIPIIVGVPSAVICVLLVSLCGIYTYIKRNPNVVYGKENVIVVERKNSKKITVQDQNFEQPRYPASLKSWSDGYITPKLYESIGDLSIPYIEQYATDHLGRSRINPAIKMGHLGNEEFESIYPQIGEIYESVNTCPSPYYMNDDFSHNTYSSL